MRSVVKVGLAATLVVAAAALVLSIAPLPASGRAPTNVRRSPGFVRVSSPSGLAFYVYNPTGATIHVRGHWVDPQGTFFGGPPADITFTLAPGAASPQSFWTCQTGTCNGTPVVTVSSPRAVVTMEYLDANRGDFITVHAGELQRF